MSNSNGKYSPKRFIVSATDPKGRSARARFRISPDDREMIEAVVSSGQFPYRFPSDYYRHAVKTHLRWLSWFEDMSGILENHQTKLEFRQKEKADFYGLIFNVLKQEVEGHLSKGKNAQAQKSLLRTVARLRMEPRSSSRDYCLERIREKWWALLDGEYYPACLRHEKLPRAED